MITIRDIINKLLEYDPSLKVSFIKLNKETANDYLSLDFIERESDRFVSICLRGDYD